MDSWSCPYCNGSKSNLRTCPECEPVSGEGRKKPDTGTMGEELKTLTKEDLGNAITAIHDAFQEELFSKSHNELEQYWHFKYDETASDEKNLYHFYDMLKLYGGFCRRWEEHTGGHMCVVERVRDKYIMPKVKQFVTAWNHRLTE